MRSCIRRAISRPHLFVPIGSEVQYVWRYKLERCFQLGQIYMLSEARAMPVVYRRNYRGQGQSSQEEIGERTIGRNRRPIGPAGQVNEAGEGAENVPEPRLAVVRATSAEHGCAEHDDVVLYLLQVLVSQVPPLHSSRGEILCYHVCPFDKSFSYVPGLGVRHVQGDAILVSIVVGEIAASFHTGDVIFVGPCHPKRLYMAPGLHTYYRSPVIGQIPGSQRPDAYPAEVEHLQALEGPDSRFVIHYYHSALK